MQRHKMMEDLNLTDEQQQQVRKIRSDAMRDQISLRAKIQTLQIDLRDLFVENKPDKSKIDAKVSEIGRLQNEMKLNRIASWFSINKLLTPEQQKIWKKAPMMLDGGPGRGGFRRPMRGNLGMMGQPDNDEGSVPDGIENVEE
jgi:Spy/CpxP family protein refolding chaperone